MFCNNCGSKVAEGSNFCSVCGSRITVAEPVPVEEPVAVHPEVERTETFAAEKRTPVSFDWSSVKDEPHKKIIPDVVSPWGTTETEPKREVIKTLEEEQRSRTMGFIDILKQEREQKAAAAFEQARPVTEKEETAADYSVFEQPQAPSYYMPPMYEDVVTEPAAPATHDAPEAAAEVKDLEAELAAIIDAGREQPSEEIAEEYLAMDEYASDRSTEELTYVDDRGGKHAAESVESLESLLDELESDDEEDDFTLTDIEIENTQELDPFDTIFDQDEDKIEATSDFIDYESLMADLNSVDGAEQPAYEEAAPFEAPVYEESAAPVYEEPVAPIFEEPAAPIFEEPAATTPEEDKLSEIEELKKRLAELMGETKEEPQTEAPANIAAFAEALNTESAPSYEPSIFEPVALETADEEKEAEDAEDSAEETVEPVAEPAYAAEPVVEEAEEVSEEATEQVADLADFAADVAVATEETVATEAAEEPADYEEELPLIDPTPEVEEELSLLGEEEPEEEQEEKADEEPSTDAMSVEELEKDLFGEVSEEDIVAEETKKIEKFYTLYKKNEEFQRLLDEEYDRLRNEEAEEVPTVSAILEKTEEKAEDVPVVKQEAPQAVEAAPVTEVIKDAEEAPSKGGTALTVIAVIVAVLLVILLAVILILNFAPDSGLAIKLDSVIETITSYFSAVDAPGKFLL